MRVTSELAPVRWPVNEAGETSLDRVVAFARAAARRLEPSFDVEVALTDHAVESKDYDYTLETWR